VQGDDQHTTRTVDLLLHVVQDLGQVEACGGTGQGQRQVMCVTSRGSICSQLTSVPGQHGTKPFLNPDCLPC
jgi:hypothetical protein